MSKKDEAVKKAVKSVKDKIREEKPETSAPKKPGEVYFVSAQPEPISFEIEAVGNKIKGYWDGDHAHLCWRVPSDIADRFAMHHHVQTGRIIRSKD